MTIKVLDLVKLAEYTRKIQETYVSKKELPAELQPYAKSVDLPVIATTAQVGLVRPDGNTITVDDSGLIRAAIDDMLTQTSAAETYATKTEVEEGCIPSSKLSDLTTKEYVRENYVSNTTIQNYATKDDISSVYTPKGSITFNDLKGKNKPENVGDVYNIIDAFATDENFVEGPAATYPAGMNVVIVEDSGDYKFDVLAGMVDLTPYLKIADLDTITTSEIEELFAEV